MSARSRDQKIVAILSKKFGGIKNRYLYDEEGNLTHLYLLTLNLSELPAEIGQLINLRILLLNSNHLTQFPAQISQLTNLHELDLNGNQLTQLPPEIGQLTNLQKLYLSDNDLTQLPPEIGLLTKLQELDLERNHLTQLPPEIGQLTNLHELDLGDNQLTQLSPQIGQLTNLRKLVLNSNHLTQLSPQIGQLTNLQELYLYENQLTQLPPQIVQLTNLQKLYLDDNQLTQLPPEIGQLTNLHVLDLERNHLTQFPAQISQLTNLHELDLNGNQLTQLPPEIGQLANLQELYLSDNNLTQLPPEIGQLTNLEQLDLERNHLTQLPPEIGQLTNLTSLSVDNNPHLLTPPPEIVMSGTANMLVFLQELQKHSIIRYEAKLLVVGEGGTGKSSLLRSLRNEAFDADLSTTHGIEVDHLHLLHQQSPTQITLNTWDFGGQHIYHATHQFFLTKRSLYLVVWNARLGAEQGRLHFWLDTIKALAPDAPVLLVATHTDERASDLNYQLYKDAYPQLAGNFSVSNKNKAGLDELQIALALHARALPLMGQPWPMKWVKVEKALSARQEHHIDANRYIRICAIRRIEAKIAQGTLGSYLHDLGKILYFRDDPVLSNLVVLKPNWVTKAIGHVLTDEATSNAKGILSHAALPRIWSTDDDGHPYESHLYPVFLRLMERFDLSYQIDPERPGEPSTRSLVPQLLPHQPPANLPPWPKVPVDGQSQVEMRYRFDFVPAGIMSWFIVRSHRYTQNLHWREGVILEYQDHQARVELNPMLRELRLVVWGVQPHNFFTILMNTMDLILDRFEGLRVQREIPCICHWQLEIHELCPRFYRYEDLVRRMKANKHEVECPDSYINVSVPELLYGIHMSTNRQVIADIRQGQQELLQVQQQMLYDLTMLPEIAVILKEMNQRSELIWRALIRQWNFEMQRMEAECPNIFFLTLGSTRRFNPKNWVSQEYRLYLVCQHPPGPHQVGDGYSLREAKDWWISISPWLNHLVTFLKIGIPLGKAIGAVYDEIDVDNIKTNIDLMEEITKDLPTIATLDTLSNAVPEPNLYHDQQVVGPALRALHSFLTKADPSHIWGGLHKTVTPDGNILWLCDIHRQQYEAKPLQLNVKAPENEQ